MDQFNWKQYLANYPDLTNAGINDHVGALKHWNVHGKNEGRTDKSLINNSIIPVIQKNSRQLNLFLSTNVRDEKNIVEWIDYHSRIGFHTILVVDHLSKIPVADIVKQHSFKCICF